jgi:BirA family biotin operon repressor/biotin-[acetyl-CoA-carboxylase] ligase
VSEQIDLARVDSLLRTDFVGRKVLYKASVSTTMEVAAREAESGAPEGELAIADEQSAGRGRMSRTWVSPPGVNLYFTIIMRPRLEQLRYLAVITPLAVCQAIEETTALQPRIKWPNDVLIDGKKVSGILIESELSEERVRYALVGCGIGSTSISTPASIQRSRRSRPASVARPASASSEKSYWQRP